MYECKDKGSGLISGFCREEEELCPILKHHATYAGNSLTTFRENVSAPSSKVKKSKKASWISGRC